MAVRTQTSRARAGIPILGAAANAHGGGGGGGITWSRPSGDAGVADCATTQFSGMLSVYLPASLPSVTAVAAPQLNEGPVN